MSSLAKSEILFLYESTYSIPNGDPFTGEQRYDEETKKVLVSDVRIKRFIRDYFINKGEEIYIVNSSTKKQETSTKKKQSGSDARMKELKELDKNKELSGKELLCGKCIDVRLFGGISTEKGDAFNLTGPVQFALLNPSLNSVDLRIHQNTSVFVSDTEKSQGAIGTTTLVPYSLNQIHGWINPFAAQETKLTNNDVGRMFSALWHSINNANTRSKSNQNSLLLLQIVYKRPVDKLYHVDRMIQLKPNEGKRQEQIRSLEDYQLNFDKLSQAAQSDMVEKINYICAIDALEKQLLQVNGLQEKARKIELTE